MSGLVRTGRGGAGNFLSQSDVEEAENAHHANDLESQSQPPAAAAAAAAPAAQQVAQYVRSGRGGAGNFADPPTLAESQAREDVVDRTEAAVAFSQAGKPRTGLSGRGGAGNWTDNSEAAKQDGDADADADDVQSKQSQIEDKVVHDIEASLPPPPRTYHQHDRDMQK